jgi:SAM-dependent methyltransferase
VICRSIAIVLLTAGAGALNAQPGAVPAPSAAKTRISYADATAVFDSLRESVLPAEFRHVTAAERQTIWLRWIATHDGHVRRRLERGDDDSVVNLLLFGVTFTRQPRIDMREMLRLLGDGRAGELIQSRPLQARIDDLIDGIASPGANQRLQFARGAAARWGVDLRAAGGRTELRRHLELGLRRVFGEYEGHFRETSSAAPYSERGLSSDTSIYPAFAVERALQDITQQGAVRPGDVRRVAIVGPGLDFTDKREGYDFYPQQTLQPFALIDSLTRLGLVAGEGLRVTTLDVSPRITEHLAGARDRARAKARYTLVLPRDLALPWAADLVAYWKRLGDTIAREVKAAPAPAAAGRVEVRAIAVNPAAVLSIVPEEIDIVVERLDLTRDERYDLIIATNVLVYYDTFEQSLALANIAGMLRPGGLFLTNDPIVVLPATPLHAIGATELQYTALPNSRDALVWYQRQ